MMKVIQIKNTIKKGSDKYYSRWALGYRYIKYTTIQKGEGKVGTTLKEYKILASIASTKYQRIQK